MKKKTAMPSRRSKASRRKPSRRGYAEQTSGKTVIAEGRSRVESSLSQAGEVHSRVDELHHKADALHQSIEQVHRTVDAIHEQRKEETPLEEMAALEQEQAESDEVKAKPFYIVGI